MKTRVLSLVIAAVMLFSVLTLASCGKKSFNYAKEDLSAYITLTEKDYRNVPVSIATGITAANVYAEISTAISELSDEKLASIAKTDRAIAENDIAAIYYRGVTADAEGKETGFEGGTNLGDVNPTWLYIGSDAFIEGFEDALIGKLPTDSSITEITEGKVAEDDLVVLEIAGMYGEKEPYLVYDNLAVKLDETTILPQSVIDKLVGATIGEELIFDIDMDADGDKEEENVVFAAKVFRKLDVKAEKITVKFPSDYQDSALAGKEAFFYVVVESVVTPDAATVEALGYAAGDDAVAALKAGAEKALVNDYIANLKGEDHEDHEGHNHEEEFANTVKVAIWSEISGRDYDVTYPANTVESYIKTEKNNLNYAYNAGADAESIQSTYKTLDDYAAYVYGDEDWESVIEKDAKDFVKRKLVFYTIAKTLGVNEATKAEKSEVKAELETAYVDYYTQMYTIYNAIGGWGYTTEQIKTLAQNEAKAVVDSMTDTYISEAVIKEKILDKLYEGYDVDSLVTWTTSVADAEDASDKDAE